MVLSSFFYLLTGILLVFPITLQLLRCSSPAPSGKIRQKFRCLPIAVLTPAFVRDAFRVRDPYFSLVIDLPSGKISFVLGVFHYTRFTRFVKGIST